MATVSVQIEGLDDLRRQLGKAVDPVLQGAMMASAEQLRNYVAPYPPETSANQAGGPGSRWYVRGYGPHWMRKDNSIGSAKTSQMLNRQWQVRKLGSTGAQTGNRASYAPFVHGEGNQASFHKARGWQTEMQGITRLLRERVIERMIQTALMKVFGR